MTSKQVAALVKAHTHLLNRVAELEADAVITREAIFTLLDSLVKREGKPHSVELEEKLNSLQKDRISIATRAAGAFQDEMLDGNK